MSDPTDEATDVGDGSTGVHDDAAGGTDAAATVDAVATTTARVHEFLAPFEDVEINADGTCSLCYGSARVVVSVEVFDEDQAVVQVQADCVTGAEASAELFEHVATHRAEFGHLRVAPVADGTATIALSHSLLGEFLNPAELRMTVVAVAYSADVFDDELAARFGGQVHDAAANTV